MAGHIEMFNDFPSHVAMLMTQLIRQQQPIKAVTVANRASVAAMSRDRAAQARDNLASAVPPHNLGSKSLLDLPAAALLTVLAACSGEAERALRCTCSTLAAMPKELNPSYVALKAMAHPAEPGMQASPEIISLLARCVCNRATVSFIMGCNSEPVSILMQPDLACWMMAYAGRTGDFTPLEWLLKVSQVEQATALRNNYTEVYDRAWIAAAGHAAGGNQTSMLAALLELPCAPGRPAGLKSLSIELQTALLLGAVSGPTPSTSVAKVIHLCRLIDACQNKQDDMWEGILPDMEKWLAERVSNTAMAEACVSAAKLGYAQAVPALVQHGLVLDEDLIQKVLAEAVQYDHVGVVESVVHVPFTADDATTSAIPVHVSLPDIMIQARRDAILHTPLPAMSCVLAIDKLVCNDTEDTWIEWEILVADRHKSALAALLAEPEYEKAFRSLPYSRKAELLGLAAGRGDMAMLELLLEYDALPNPSSLLPAAHAYSHRLASSSRKRRAWLACFHRLLELLLIISECYQLQQKYFGYKMETPGLTKAQKQALSKQQQQNLFKALKGAKLLNSRDLFRSFCMIGEKHLVKLILTSPATQLEFDSQLLGDLASLCSWHCGSKSELLCLAIQKGASIFEAIKAAYTKTDVTLLANLVQDINNHHNGIKVDPISSDDGPFLSLSEFQQWLQQEWDLSRVPEKNSRAANNLVEWLAELSVGDLNANKRPQKMEQALWALQCLLKDHGWTTPSVAVLLPCSLRPRRSRRNYQLLEWLLTTFGPAAINRENSNVEDEQTWCTTEMIARNAPLPFTILLAKHGADRGHLIRGLAARRNQPMYLIQQLMSGHPVSLAKLVEDKVVGHAHHGFQLSDTDLGIALRGALQNENMELLDYLIQQGPGWVAAAKQCQPSTKPYLVHHILSFANGAEFDTKMLSQAMAVVPEAFVLPLMIIAVNHLDVNEVLLATAKSGCVAAVETLLDDFQADPYHLLEDSDIFPARGCHVALAKFLLKRHELKRPGKKALRLRLRLKFVVGNSQPKTDIIRLQAVCHHTWFHLPIGLWYYPM